MGLPQISITFSKKASTAIKRSAQGVVGLLLKDTTKPEAPIIVEYKNFNAVAKEDWTAENLDLIEKAFLGFPQKVITVRIGELKTIDEILPKIKSTKINYLAFPGGETAEITKLVDWVKTQRTKFEKPVKAVVANTKADYEGVINFTTDKIVVGGKTYTAAQYTPRIAGILAGLPFTQSATYQVLTEVESIEEKEDANSSIDAGELILIFDGEKHKIGRGVNSLTTVKDNQGEDWKKIRIIEIYDIVRNDIYEAFENDYVGKVPNTYDNQLLFINYVNQYFKGLMRDEILDPTATNESYIDVDAQREAWEKAGVDTTELDDSAIKEKPFGSNIFAAGTIKAVDAMEDLLFKITA